jgi:Na+-driven multidrug efflux pump
MLFLLLSACIGATLIVSRSTLFRPLQRLYAPLFGCSQCTGTWVGIAAGAGGLVTTGHGRVVDALVVGCATSFLAMAADGVLLYLLGDPKDHA